MFQLLLEALALRHVSDVQHDAPDVGVVRLIGDQRLRVQMLTPVVSYPKLDQHRIPSLLVVRLHRVERLRHVVGVHQLGEPAALQGLRVVAEHACDRGAHVADRGVAVDHADDVGRVAHERREPRLALLLEQVPGESGRLQSERDLRAQRGQRVGEGPVHLVGSRDDHQPPELVLDEQGRREDRALLDPREVEVGDESALVRLDDEGRVRLQLLALPDREQGQREAGALRIAASRRRHHHEPSGPLRRVAHAHGGVGPRQRRDAVDRGTVDAVLARRRRELGARLAERLLPDRGSLLRSCQTPHTCDDEQEHHDRGVDEHSDAFSGLTWQQLQSDHRRRDERCGRQQGEPEQPEGPLVAGGFGQRCHRGVHGGEPDQERGRHCAEEHQLIGPQHRDGHAGREEQDRSRRDRWRRRPRRPRGPTARRSSVGA